MIMICNGLTAKLLMYSMSFRFFIVTISIMSCSADEKFKPDRFIYSIFAGWTKLYPLLIGILLPNHGLIRGYIAVFTLKMRITGLIRNSLLWHRWVKCQTCLGIYNVCLLLPFFLYCSFEPQKSGYRPLLGDVFRAISSIDRLFVRSDPIYSFKWLFTCFWYSWTNLDNNSRGDQSL